MKLHKVELEFSGTHLQITATGH